MIVVDASVLLATIMEEPGGYDVIDRARGGAISSVNWCEVATRLADKGLEPHIFHALASRFGLRCVAFDQQQADLAAKLRAPTRDRGLSLGDRACLALGMTLNATVLTADRPWGGLDIGVQIELIR